MDLRDLLVLVERIVFFSDLEDVHPARSQATVTIAANFRWVCV